MDFSKIKIRASSVGGIMTKSKDKGNAIGSTCATKLVAIYTELTTGRRKDLKNNYVEKGNSVEGQSIKLFNSLMGINSVKNEIKFENYFITGTPDLILTKNGIKKIVDIKSKWDVHTFEESILKGVIPQYYWQLQCYMWLTGAECSEIANCLVNTPINIIEKEKNRVKYEMMDSDDWKEEESKEYIDASNNLEKSMLYYDIPQERRLFIQKVERNEKDIKKISEKVENSREWLINFDKKRAENKKEWGVF